MAKRKDCVVQFCHAQRWKVERLFDEAAKWLHSTFGRKIRKGEVLNARKTYEKRGTIANFITLYLSSRHESAAVA